MKGLPFGDVRDLTHKARVEIGFRDREDWREAEANFDGHTLRIHDHPVMEDWEDNLMKELATIATANGGTVIEIGYGLGLSAGYIQEANIKKHIIIEANREIHLATRKLAESGKNVFPVFGFWEEITPQLEAESVDGILFDTYPLTEEDIHKNHFRFFPEAYRLLKPGGIFTYYSDEINTFSKEHLLELKSAGFTDIKSRICRVYPPPNCEYWKGETMLVPIIRK